MSGGFSEPRAGCPCHFRTQPPHQQSVDPPGFGEDAVPGCDFRPRGLLESGPSITPNRQSRHAHEKLRLCFQVPLPALRRGGVWLSYLALAATKFGLSGLMSICRRCGISTRSMSSIGIAPSNTSSPITTAPTYATRFLKCVSIGPTYGTHSFRSVGQGNFLHHGGLERKLQSNMLGNDEINRSRIGKCVCLHRF